MFEYNIYWDDLNKEAQERLSNDTQEEECIIPQDVLSSKVRLTTIKIKGEV